MIQSAIPKIPAHIYCNKDLFPHLGEALSLVVTRKLTAQIKTWDGCFNIRAKRDSTSQSLHSWGLAIDINASCNQLGCKPKMTMDLVRCFTDAGFEWGGSWHYPDGMHFQIARLL